jgi:hypothetical protein
MIRKWFGISALIVTAGILLGLASCGRDQQLVSIQVQPASETFGASNIPLSQDAGAQVQLRALGTYIHPPVTKDITTQVTWTSNTPQMMTVDANGLVTVTGLACGSTLISATVTTNKSAGGIGSSGALVTGYMTGSVVCFTGTSGGGGSGPSLTVNFQGTGSGTVSSNPPGLSCASGTTCFSNSFSSGTNVSITAAPNGTFGGWAGCDSVDGTGLTCMVDNLTTARTVTATFN